MSRWLDRWLNKPVVLFITHWGGYLFIVNMSILTTLDILKGDSLLWLLNPMLLTLVWAWIHWDTHKARIRNWEQTDQCLDGWRKSNAQLAATKRDLTDVIYQRDGLLRLLHKEGYSAQEVADAMGISVIKEGENVH
jgi:hypothetical protein